ncbi:MAG: NUMOD1 domain-containing DNA-binding protein [Clostridiaceae bacterium]|nr:NUMOD1 domain-containing DNA-binding protein [Clostridiaceae bacterium]
MLINILSRFLIKLSRYLTKCIKRFLKKTKSKSSKSRKINPITLKSEQVIKKPTQKPQTNSVKSKLKLANTLFEDEKLLLKQASSDLHKSIKKLKPFEKIDFSAPNEKDTKIYLPIEGTFNAKFFLRMYMLRNHKVENQIISDFDYIQYQVPVKATNEELILLVYGSHAMNKPAFIDDTMPSIGKSLCDYTDIDVAYHCQTINNYKKLVSIINSIRGRGISLTECKEYIEAQKSIDCLKEWIKTTLEEVKKEFIKSDFKSPKWVQEYKLFSYIKLWHNDAIFQYHPEWLNGLYLDIFIPSINTAVEYQGQQHYEPIEYFGGEERFFDNKERDTRKQILCKNNGVTLLEWPYSQKITYTNVCVLVDKFRSEFENLQNNTKHYYCSEFFIEKSRYSQIKKAIVEEKKQEIKKAKVESSTVIRQYDLDGSFLKEFDTLLESSNTVGVGVSSIQKCVSGQRKTAGGYIWIREKRNDQPLNKTDVLNTIKRDSTHIPGENTCKPVAKIDISSGEIIEIFPSIKSAAQGVGINPSGIRDVLNGKQKTAGGFFWVIMSE